MRGSGRQWFKAMPIRAQQMRHRQRIQAVVFGGRKDMPIFVSIDRLGIDGIDLVAVTQQVIDQQPTGGFQRHQHRSGVCLMLGNLRVERRETLRIMGDLELDERGGRVIRDADIVMIISPLNDHQLKAGGFKSFRRT